MLPEAAAAVIGLQIGNEEIVLKFPNEEEAKKAAADLFGGQKFVKIVPNVRSLRYSIGKTGVLCIRVS